MSLAQFVLCCLTGAIKTVIHFVPASRSIKARFAYENVGSCPVSIIFPVLTGYMSDVPDVMRELGNSRI